MCDSREKYASLCPHSLSNAAFLYHLLWAAAGTNNELRKWALSILIPQYPLPLCSPTVTSCHSAVLPPAHPLDQNELSSVSSGTDTGKGIPGLVWLGFQLTPGSGSIGGIILGPLEICELDDFILADRGNRS